MKHIEFHPAKKEQVSIELRGSTLNSFMNPSPHEFKDLDNRVECMNLGDRMHSVAQATMLLGRDRGIHCAKRHIQELQGIGPFVRDKEIRWFMEGGAFQIVDIASERFVDPFSDEIYEHKEICRYIEEKRQVLIDFSGYLVNFSGTSDADLEDILHNGQLWGNMIDIKSSGKKWDQLKADSERQKYYYTFLKCINEGLVGCRFRYHIYTKQKTVQFQEFEYWISFEEAARVTKQDLKYYITTEVMNA